MSQRASTIQASVTGYKCVATMITYKKAALRIAELWFDEEPCQSRIDIVRCFQRSAPMSHGTWTRFHTILIDLTQAADFLLAGMKKDTRYEIRRADSRDRIAFHQWMPVDHACLARFAAFYDQHSLQKGPVAGAHGRLTEWAKTDSLVLSEVRDEKGSTLVWHAYYFTKDRVRLVHSVSCREIANDSSWRAMLGRANRFHHWRDILAFAQQAVHFYDFGGWYEGNTDTKKLSINRFKEEFGGQIVVGYNGQAGLTLAGRAALWCHARIRGSSQLNQAS